MDKTMPNKIVIIISKKKKKSFRSNLTCLAKQRLKPNQSKILTIQTTPLLITIAKAATNITKTARINTIIMTKIREEGEAIKITTQIILHHRKQAVVKISTPQTTMEPPRLRTTPIPIPITLHRQEMKNFRWKATWVRKVVPKVGTQQLSSKTSKLHLLILINILLLPSRINTIIISKVRITIRTIPTNHLTTKTITTTIVVTLVSKIINRRTLVIKTTTFSSISPNHRRTKRTSSSIMRHLLRVAVEMP